MVVDGNISVFDVCVVVDVVSILIIGLFVGSWYGAKVSLYPVRPIWTMVYGHP